MEAVEWVALVASVATLFSCGLNIYQWRRGTEILKAARAYAQAGYNTFHRVAVFADRIRKVARDGAEDLAKALQVATEQAHGINGAADAARLQISAYSREHLNFIPKVEKAWDPSPERLAAPRNAQRDSVTE